MGQVARRLAVAAVSMLAAVPVATATTASATTPTEVEQAIDASAVFAHPASDGIPKGVFGIANPSLICIFAPCPPEASEVIALISDPLGATQDVHGQATPVQALPEDSIAVSLRFGAREFESAIRFEVPPPPSGQQYQRFEVVLPQADPTFHTSSPTFRDAVNAAFILVRDEDPEGAADRLMQGLTNQPIDQQVLEVRACPLRVAFTPTESPSVAQSADIPRDEFGAIDMACQFGAFGVYDDAGSWSFDLTRAANAWSSGELENHGLMIMPVRTNFVGLGDEDPSTNAQVTFPDLAVTLRTLTEPLGSGFFVPDPAPVPPNLAAPSAPSPVTIAPAPITPPASGAPIAPDVAPQAPVTAPAPVPVAGGFDLSAFGTERIDDGILWIALALIVASGTLSYQFVRRRRARPIAVARPA